MKQRIDKNQEGMVEVEATFIFPIMILCVILLLYVSLFLYQRANLQASLETALLYYKNTLTDTYVERSDTIEYLFREEAYIGKANTYSADRVLNPYRWVDGKNKSQESFEVYYQSVTENMLFGEPEITYDYTNYLLMKEIKVTATQTVEAPINFALIGVDNSYEISVTSRMVAVDHDDTIRNVDYIFDLLEETKVGEFFSNISDKAVELYGKMKEVLGI